MKKYIIIAMLLTSCGPAGNQGNIGNPGPQGPTGATGATGDLAHKDQLELMVLL